MASPPTNPLQLPRRPTLRSHNPSSPSAQRLAPKSISQARPPSTRSSPTLRTILKTSASPYTACATSLPASSPARLRALLSAPPWPAHPAAGEASSDDDDDDDNNNDDNNDDDDTMTCFLRIASWHDPGPGQRWSGGAHAALDIRHDYGDVEHCWLECWGWEMMRIACRECRS